MEGCRRGEGEEESGSAWCHRGKGIQSFWLVGPEEQERRTKKAVRGKDK